MKRFVIIVAQFILAKALELAGLMIVLGVFLFVLAAAAGELPIDGSFNAWPLVYVMGAIAAACYAAVGAR